MATIPRDGAARQRPGRRAGDSYTREMILATAREQFARHGYAGASVRAIAAAAGVDPATVRHFYGSKDGLFAATLAFPPQMPQRLIQALHGDPASWASDSSAPTCRCGKTRPPPSRCTPSCAPR